jgi:hypothetical protein
MWRMTVICLFAPRAQFLVQPKIAEEIWLRVLDAVMAS